LKVADIVDASSVATSPEPRAIIFVWPLPVVVAFGQLIVIVTLPFGDTQPVTATAVSKATAAPANTGMRIFFTLGSFG
jgi:hypothetical protein